MFGVNYYKMECLRNVGRWW